MEENNIFKDDCISIIKELEKLTKEPFTEQEKTDFLFCFINIGIKTLMNSSNKNKFNFRIVMLKYKIDNFNNNSQLTKEIIEKYKALFRYYEYSITVLKELKKLLRNKSINKDYSNLYTFILTLSDIYSLSDKVIAKSDEIDYEYDLNLKGINYCSNKQWNIKNTKEEIEKSLKLIKEGSKLNET